MRKRISIRDFIAGGIVGLLLGSASLSVASISYEGWTHLSQEFKVGYVTGFLGLANLMRNLEPGGYLDTRYPMITQAQPVEWAAVIDELYKNPENQQYRIHSILQAAADQLKKKYGKPMDPQERLKQRMQSQLAFIEKKKQARAAKEGQAAPKSAKDPKLLEAPEKTVKPAIKKPTIRKWCRCDGKDPKAERAKRRAAREEEAKKAAAEKVEKAPVPASK